MAGICRPGGIPRGSLENTWKLLLATRFQIIGKPKISDPIPAFFCIRTGSYSVNRQNTDHHWSMSCPCMGLPHYSMDDLLKMIVPQESSLLDLIWCKKYVPTFTQTWQLKVHQNPQSRRWFIAGCLGWTLIRCTRVNHKKRHSCHPKSVGGCIPLTINPLSTYYTDMLENILSLTVLITPLQDLERWYHTVIGYYLDLTTISTSWTDMTLISMVGNHGFSVATTKVIPQLVSPIYKLVYTPHWS